MMRKVGAIVASNQRFLPLTTTIVLFFLAYAIGAASYGGMRDPQVFFNLFRTSPFLLISAVGMTFVILSGGIDLSVSGVVALTTVASAALLRTGNWNPWVVMLLMLAMGMALGAIMGAFITYLKVQPFIATLAGMWFARGMCFFISDDAIPINNRLYRILGQTKILIPGLADPVTKQGAYVSILVILELVVLVVALYIAHFTRFGRSVYAIGGGTHNEQSARLMGLPVNRTKMSVYILNGFCSALAGIALSIYVSSGHGLYAPAFEMTVIAAVVIGGTMLTGGEGYVLGTLFGVLVTGLIQTLIQFNGRLSSWWTNIVVGALTLAFIGVQSLLAARRKRQLATQRLLGQAKYAGAPGRRPLPRRTPVLRGRQIALGSAGAVLLVVVAVLATISLHKGDDQPGAGTPSAPAGCQAQAFRQDQAAQLMREGAVVAYERNGGATCIDELYAIYPDGRIIGDNGTDRLEKQVTAAELETLLAGIDDKGWFTNEMYTTFHTPCGQCYVYYITVSYQGREKTVQAVDGGTDAPANYWQVVSLINGVIPHFP